MLRLSAVSVLAVLSILACSGEPADGGVKPTIPTSAAGNGSGATANMSGAGPSTAGNGNGMGGSANSSGNGAGGNGTAGSGTAGSGTAGNGTSGSGGDGGVNLDDPKAVIKSKGCGSGPPAGLEPAVYAKFEVDVTGVTLTDFKHPAHKRAYYVWVPEDYDNNKPYRVVHIMYGCGDKYAGATATYKLFNEDPQAIYVGLNMPPAGVADNEGTCYNDDGGADATEWEFFDLVNQQLDANFCFDKNRVFAAGYSSGSWVAQMFGCYFSGFDSTRKFGKDLSLRGEMTVTGGLPDVPACSTKPVASLWIHDASDSANQISGSLINLDRILALNKCTGKDTTPWGEDALKTICKQYTGCPADYPVVFCTTTGRNHDSQNDNALPAFSQFAHLMDAK
jgi:poly(3-hydroxybutyrate) depolymerase